MYEFTCMNCMHFQPDHRKQCYYGYNPWNPYTCTLYTKACPYWRYSGALVETERRKEFLNEANRHD